MLSFGSFSLGARGWVSPRSLENESRNVENAITQATIGDVDKKKPDLLI